MTPTRRVEKVVADSKAKKNGEAVGGKVFVPAPNYSLIEVEVVGLTPLVVHKFSHKSIREMLGTQMKLPKQTREAKDPAKDFAGSLYTLAPDKDKKPRYGMPAIAFKKAIATTHLETIKLAGGEKGGKGPSRGSVYTSFWIRSEPEIVGDEPIAVLADGTPIVASPIGCVEILAAPTMRTDIVRLAGPTRPPDIRFRGEFTEWAARLTIELDIDFWRTEEAFMMPLVRSGRKGVGEFRPEKAGEWGMYEVKSFTVLKKTT